jgi:HEPN domain-containing protein
MPHRLEFQEMALLKIKEANLLHKNGLYHGAFYLSGYAMEFALKAAVCRNLDMDDFFEEKKSNDKSKPSGGIFEKMKTHDIGTLLIMAGLYNKLNAFKEANEEFEIKWNYITTKQWNEQCRYDNSSMTKKYNKIDVESFIDAIDNKKGGFLKWIQHYW